MPSLRNNPVYQRLRFFLHLRQVVRALEGLGVDLVHILGAGRAGREPGVLRDNLQAANRSAIAGSLGEFGRDLFAGQ